ncbi:MAG TPA: succinate dehydrogenase, hydrophobic membrane anchor protein [Longimicrobiales bacterium]
MNNTLNRAFVHRRGRQPGGNFELYSWFFMRISGVVLLVLAVFHLFWMHGVIGVEEITFDVVAQRWSNPLWRLYDFFLLAFALTHGVNGLRGVADDYVHRPKWAVLLKSLIFLVYVVFLGMGAYIIFTFTPPAAAASLP